MKVAEERLGVLMHVVVGPNYNVPHIHLPDVRNTGRSTLCKDIIASPMTEGWLAIRIFCP